MSSRARTDRHDGHHSTRGKGRSGRYTPPSRERVAIRPRWHQVAGWFLVFVGLGVAALNGLMYMDRGLRLLPGGFSLLYVPAGLPVAAVGAWLLGLFDKGETTYR